MEGGEGEGEDGSHKVDSVHNCQEEEKSEESSLITVL